MAENKVLQFEVGENTGDLDHALPQSSLPTAKPEAVMPLRQGLVQDGASGCNAGDLDQHSHTVLKHEIPSLRRDLIGRGGERYATARVG